MLKRPRDVSPQCGPSSLPFAQPDMMEHGVSKRRRMSPPPSESPPLLDGPIRARGGDGDEEMVSEDDEWLSEDELRYPNPNYDQRSSSSPPTDAYKSSNKFLREIHTLNQHHLMFSTSASHYSSITSDRNPMPAPSIAAPLAPTSPSVDGTNSMLGPLEEEQRVRNWYGSNNKVLGSLVLSRRRDLHVMSLPNDNDAASTTGANSSPYGGHYDD